MKKSTMKKSSRLARGWPNGWEDVTTKLFAQEGRLLESLLDVRLVVFEEQAPLTNKHLASIIPTYFYLPYLTHSLTHSYPSAKNREP